MVSEDSLSLEEQTVSAGLCLNCHTAIVMDDATKKRVRQELYEIVDNKYCQQCGSPLYREKI